MLVPRVQKGGQLMNVVILLLILAIVAGMAGYELYKDGAFRALERRLRK